MLYDEEVHQEHHTNKTIKNESCSSSSCACMASTSMSFMMEWELECAKSKPRARVSLDQALLTKLICPERSCYSQDVYRSSPNSKRITKKKMYFFCGNPWNPNHGSNWSPKKRYVVIYFPTKIGYGLLRLNHAQLRPFHAHLRLNWFSQKLLKFDVLHCWTSKNYDADSFQWSISLFSTPERLG